MANCERCGKMFKNGDKVVTIVGDYPDPFEFICTECDVE